MSRAVLVLAALVPVASAFARAQELIVPAELAKIRLEIRDLEEKVRALDKRHSDLGAQRERLEGELSLAVMRVREAEAEKKVAESAVATAAAAAEDARLEVTRAVERLRLQISLLAVLGRAGLAPLVLHALGSGQDVPQRITLALALVREDKRRRDEMEGLLERRTATLADLSQRREDVEVVTRLLEERQTGLEATRGRVVAQLEALEREQREGAVALVSANEAAERLERLWGTVEGERSPESGSDITLLRGGLRWPVEDPIVSQGYGQRRDPQYGTVTISNGIEMEAKAGENVVAVAPGRVAYAQFFRGYGNLVILDHGSEVYSLYARLASILIRTGQRVGIGDPVGVVGREDDGPGRVYLEMRVGKAAQDPTSWLRPLPRR